MLCCAVFCCAVRYVLCHVCLLYGAVLSSAVILCFDCAMDVQCVCSCVLCVLLLLLCVLICVVCMCSCVLCVLLCIVCSPVVCAPVCAPSPYTAEDEGEGGGLLNRTSGGSNVAVCVSGPAGLKAAAAAAAGAIDADMHEQSFFL